MESLQIVLATEIMQINTIILNLKRIQLLKKLTRKAEQQIQDSRRK